MQKVQAKIDKNHDRGYNLKSTLAMTVILAAIEDFSAQVGCMIDGWGEVADLEGTEHLTDNGERLLCSKQAEGWR